MASSAAKVAYHAKIETIPGIGPKRAQALRAAGITTLNSLVNWFPRKYLDRSNIVLIKDLSEGMTATIVGTILKASKTRGRRPRFFIAVEDNSGLITCTWFAGAKFIAKKFKVGMKGSFTGKVSFYNGRQMTHPDFDILDDGQSGPLVPVWPIYPTPVAWREAGFDSRFFRKWARWAISNMAFKKRPIPEAVAAKNHIPPMGELLEAIHFPLSVETGMRALDQYRFMELFLLSFALLERRERNRAGGRAVACGKQLSSKVASSLPFGLTTAQKRAVHEIETDTFSNSRMNRLIQGDVGSGKTIVSLICSLHYVEAGRQVVFLAPTEILAAQHYKTFSDYLNPLGIKVCLVTGSLPAKARQKAAAAVKGGSCHVVVGTHALLSRSTRFNDLGLIVVDEQHRFGVSQRLSLYKKGSQPDILVMSATPIPRTVALVAYGDLDISMIDEKPAGRKEVMTRIVPEAKRNEMYRFVRKKIRAGMRVYTILPLVEESFSMEDISSANATAKRFKEKIFPDIKIGLVHGRLSGEEKRNALLAFRSGKTPILVSTTVVEVGMDVPEAGIMIVEHAERFGLSQLHQLRGRIGRGASESYCFLLPSKDAPEHSLDRLKLFCSTNDGFKIAEMDLKTRGPGNITGFKQSGFSFSKVSNPFLNLRIFFQARKEAASIISGKVSTTSQEMSGLKKAAAKLLKKLEGESGTA